MHLNKKATIIYKILLKQYPNACTALNHKSPEQMLIATVLSAQCTDRQVNKVTPHLFKKYPDMAALSKAKISDIESIIHSTGFFHQKAKNLKTIAVYLMKTSNGKIPRSIKQLIKLPGVGRKTANVVLGTAFGIPSGIAVDTHVKRLSIRLGFSAKTSAVKVELDLMKIVPKKRWIEWSNLLIWHGRNTCDARKPKCSKCQLQELCPKIGVSNSV